VAKPDKRYEGKEPKFGTTKGKNKAGCMNNKQLRRSGNKSSRRYETIQDDHESGKRFVKK
jgi:hypothetical protein